VLLKALIDVDDDTGGKPVAFSASPKLDMTIAT
jgi:hypothetical protein